MKYIDSVKIKNYLAQKKDCKYKYIVFSCYKYMYPVINKYIIYLFILYIFKYSLFIYFI